MKIEVIHMNAQKLHFRYILDSIDLFRTLYFSLRKFIII